MANIKVDGSMFRLKMDRVTLRGQIIEPAIFAGAKAVADAVRAEIEKIPTDERWGTPDEPANGIRKIEKLGLAYSFGVSPIQEDEKGFINVKLGFDGYNNVETNRFPNGQPNAVVARSLERGTTCLKEYPFMKKSRSKSRNACIAAMEEVMRESASKILNEKKG